MTPNANRPALIIIDMLNDFFDGQDVYDRAGLTRSINALTAAARSSGAPVIWVRQEFQPNLEDAFLEMRKHRISKTIQGTPGCQLLLELPVEPTDHEIVKKRYSAFFGTSLATLLDDLRVNCLILAGINTHACVRMTAIDAYQRDLDVIVAKDGVASYDLEHHAVSLRYLDGKIARVLDTEEIRKSILTGSENV